ncbi:hypothetical protein HGM15179_004580 [Zosterops borbonicus]|uniref:Uncharacterized protein n=1 Tax=Zosterops borbonicus TaxID=364589 RepID=A0A8K1LQG2_9PASS|nr:hypothetical protein HGM15179_004580 [Zosterops borbonicus]
MNGMVGYKLGCLLAVTYQLWITAGLNASCQSLHLNSPEFTKTVLLDEDIGQAQAVDFTPSQLQRILLDKMTSIQLDKHIMPWVSNWLMGQAQMVTPDW